MRRSITSRMLSIVWATISGLAGAGANMSACTPPAAVVGGQHVQERAPLLRDAHDIAHARSGRSSAAARRGALPRSAVDDRQTAPHQAAARAW